MTIRVKFQLTKLSQVGLTHARHARFEVVSDSTIHPDQSAQDISPAGSLEIRIDNAKALEQLHYGEFYYADLNFIEPAHVEPLVANDKGLEARFPKITPEAPAEPNWKQRRRERWQHDSEVAKGHTSNAPHVE